MSTLPYPVSAVNQTPVDYSQVHNLFLALVLLASKRHAGAGYLRRLTEALRPVDDDRKYAALCALAAELEGRQS